LNRALADLGDGCLEVAQIDALLAAAGADGVKDIFDAFWSSAGDLVDTLAGQVSGGDRAGAAASAHALKGSAANVGASGISQLAARIEEAARSEDSQALQTLLAGLLENVAATRALVDEYLAKAA